MFLCSCIVISKYSRVCPCSCVCQFLGKKCSGCSLESLVEGRGALEIREARGLKQHYLVLGNGKWTIILLSGKVSNDTLLQGSICCSCVKVHFMWSSLLKQHLPESSSKSWSFVLWRPCQASFKIKCLSIFNCLCIAHTLDTLDASENFPPMRN